MKRRAADEDLRRAESLSLLIEQQTDDLSADILYSEVIHPLKPEILSFLPIKWKAMLILKTIGAMNYKDIARIFDTNESSVRGSIKTAKLRVREHLQR